ncbi:hypothetical protein ABFS82_06G055800 [Erythranthe guttata]|uniref:Uncharacterized protein n=1 Tax=Erythranthe guttata TaxID=4155 RepID=A0A022PX77_ERYGU|nr:PREDICTED: uncharacterized protein At5g05190-like [Erythranthe guttata]EYU20134.1 hypothetical protein MIMGU_mgv1a003156mg [Erythranthe guttata]|eukprot:XP_012858277.1 PREDICTED: uncharacterized protein At5g05190-like [Erythranthe guttata]
MATQTSTKIRLVRCPKCRQILPELPGVSLYKCGVCDTILQAKIRNLETNGTESSSNQTSSASTIIQQDCVSEENNEASSSKHDSTKSGSSLDNEDNVRCQDSLQEGDSFAGTVKNLPDLESPPQNDEKGPICFADQNVGFHKNDDASQGLKVDGAATNNGLPAFRNSRREKNTSASADGSIVSFYLSSPEHFPARNFGRISSLDTLESSPPAAYNKHESRGNNNFYAYYDGSESSYDGTDFERASHFSRKNKDMGPAETNYWSTMNPSSHRPIKSSPWAPRATKSSEINTRAKYRGNLLPPRPGFNSSSEPDKSELLRTVNELKDQLNRMNFPEISSPNRMPPSGNIYNPRCNIPRLAFSGDAASHYMHRDICSCPHCSPQNYHYSAQFPTNYSCGAHTSPHRYRTSSEFSLRKSNDMKRSHPAKRHLRPLAGGAPFVACYRCSELLLLPADFILFEKRYHRLKCNACKKVLKYSLLEGTRLVPYLPEASAPPPSATSRRNTPGPPPPRPLSHCSSCGNVDAVSYSDDYGRSLCKSCSTGGEAEVRLPPSFDEEAERKSYYYNIKMKSTLKSKATSEIEEIPESSNSPLHRLMGYSSPSQVLNK